MKNTSKIAIVGGLSGLAAYLFLVRPQQAKSDAEDEENRKNFNQLPLKAHSFLAGVPLYTVGFTKLEGGRENMSMKEIYEAVGLSDIGKIELGPVTKGLFWLRTLIGEILRWDDVPELAQSVSYLPRLSAEERAKSLIPPGKVAGISQVLYCYENEIMLEIINKTVHCFWGLALERAPDGYNVYNAVYVKDLNWRTPIYMTLVSPVLKWVIYPAIEKSIRENWECEFPKSYRRGRIVEAEYESER
ncbi:MAG TPA: DUF2867 domain-containing protein [Pyrinomonadaceae bacterium]|nr:DUF2867 domain-containing protein [Pyrinomonadaceae bacterium]